MLTIIDAKKPYPPQIHFFTGNNQTPIETLVQLPKDLNGKNDFRVFLGWLDQAIRTFKKEAQQNSNDFAQRVLEGQTQYDLFPTYDKEKARSLIEQIARDVQGKPDLEIKEIDALCANIILGKDINLNENQNAHKDLAKHLIISQLSQFSDLIKTYKNLLKEKFLESLQFMTQGAQTRVNQTINGSESVKTLSGTEPEEMIDLDRFKEQLEQGNPYYISSIRDAKSKGAKTSIINILHEYLVSIQATPTEFQLDVAKVFGKLLFTNTRVLEVEQINTIGEYWDDIAQTQSHLKGLANIISKLSLGESLD